jgi:hypothetical protein
MLNSPARVFFKERFRGRLPWRSRAATCIFDWKAGDASEGTGRLINEGQNHSLPGVYQGRRLALSYQLIFKYNNELWSNGVRAGERFERAVRDGRPSGGIFRFIVCTPPVIANFLGCSGEHSIVQVARHLDRCVARLGRNKIIPESGDQNQ